MPYRSIAQQKFMHTNHPEIAKRWDKETKNFKSLPMRITKKKNGGYAGIHIKKKNIGKFTSTKDKTRETTEELTHSSNPITKKRAIFAQNAKKWNHKKYGGTVRGKMAKYALGGGVGDGDAKKSIKRTGTAEDKPGLKAIGGNGEYNAPTTTPDGKPYTGKVYLTTPRKPISVPNPVEKSTPKFGSSASTVKGLVDGGEVEGEGTETSDSNEAVVKKGSFIIPAGIRNKLKNLLNSGKKANMNQRGGVPVMLSKGEEVVDPDESKEIDSQFKKSGVKRGINMLAPKARRKFNSKQFVKRK